MCKTCKTKCKNAKCTSNACGKTCFAFSVDECDEYTPNICDECIYKDEESSLCASHEGGVCLSYYVKNWFGKIKTKVNTIFDVDED
ncbi:MAG: hypothetical protein PHE29_11215 [Tissierellia bacterium]|nr:hypothetical protein [Tissierellia bacterium]